MAGSEIREPMTPDEADRAFREFERQMPGGHQTSGRRTVERNRLEGGSVDSKHLLGMARDYGFKTQSEIARAGKVALDLGFWFKFYAWGIHLQGLPPGPLPAWWRDKYGDLPT